MKRAKKAPLHKRLKIAKSDDSQAIKKLWESDGVDSSYVSEAIAQNPFTPIEVAQEIAASLGEVDATNFEPLKAAVLMHPDLPRDTVEEVLAIERYWAGGEKEAVTDQDKEDLALAERKEQAHYKVVAAVSNLQLPDKVWKKWIKESVAQIAPETPHPYWNTESAWLVMRSRHVTEERIQFLITEMAKYSDLADEASWQASNAKGLEAERLQRVWDLHVGDE